MHAYGILLRFLPPLLAGVVLATIYAAMIILIILLTPLEPADFDYGRY